jgi:hypothetical protein
MGNIAHGSAGINPHATNHSSGAVDAISYFSNLTAFFLQTKNWNPDWNTIKIVPGGWYWRFSKKTWNKRCTAANWLREIHYDPSVNERQLILLMVHELTHIWQQERDGLLNMITEYILHGYKNSLHELEAQKMEQEYIQWQRS